VPPRSPDALRGSLDLLILKTLSLAPMHGWGISQRIQQLSRDALQVGQGSLYPALAKLERGFDVDLADVEAMVQRGLVEPAELPRLFAAIEDELYRFPSVDGKTLLARVRQLAIGDAGWRGDIIS
jgi:hypothetical protein